MVVVRVRGGVRHLNERYGLPLWHASVARRNPPQHGHVSATSASPCAVKANKTWPIHISLIHGRKKKQHSVI